MEFDNISRDYKLDSFSQSLPTYIINNFSDLEYLNILYAPKIIPSIYEKNSDLNNGILINGRFLSSYDNIIISFDAFDVDTWEKKTYRSYYCKSNDSECIERALKVCINESILPLFCPFYDCLGKCNGSAKVDCLGECDGKAKLDCEGTCNGNAVLDCKGTCWGSATLDNCGVCDYDSSNDCLEDCKGVWGGDAYINECDICISEDMDESSGMDCLGACGGDAVLDCNGECNGSSFINECNVCVGGNTNNNVNLGMDCYGICYGSTLLDACGICGGDNSSCSDCMGKPNGNALIDNCGKCDYDTSNDCMQDCNGDWGGLAFLNECSVCVGGNTNFSLDKGLDCNGTCWGNAKLDECGICNGTNNCSQSDMVSHNINVPQEEFLKKNIKKIHDHTSINLSPRVKKIKNYENINQNTSYLLSMLDDIKKSLYKVEILDVKNKTVNDKVNLTIPIEYSINDEFLAMFSNIPYKKKENSNGTVIYEINKGYFNVDEDLNNYLSSMNYQIIPVVFLIDSNKKIEKIIIDSWNDDNYNLNTILGKGIKVDFSNQFSPLISITPGKTSIQFNFQFNVLQNDYSLLMTEDDYLEYEYVLVDFFYYKNLSNDLNTFLVNY